MLMCDLSCSVQPGRVVTLVEDQEVSVHLFWKYPVCFHTIYSMPYYFHIPMLTVLLYKNKDMLF